MRFWFLDFEGALSLPVTSQTGVVFNPSCAVMLTDLSNSNSDLVAIISSAPLTDIRAKIPVDGIIIGGSNGLEWSLPDGRHLLYDSCLEEQLQLRRKVVMPWLEVLGRKPGIEVEDRKWSVIIHRHKSGRAVSDKVVTDIVSWATHEKLFIRRNGDSLEVHLIQEFNKSRGAAFLAGTLNMSPEEDTILYVGDTKTDAVAMWWAIMTGGTAIMVGSHPEIPGAICVQDQQELMETVQRFQNSGNTALTTKRSRKKLAHGPTAPKSGTLSL